MDITYMKDFHDLEREEISRLLEFIQDLSVFRELPEDERITLDYGDKALEIEKTKNGTKVYGYGRTV